MADATIRIKLGGLVDPNFMDTSAVYSMASWILAELIRIFHQVKTEQAQATVDGLVERKTPLIWSPGTVNRVIDTKLSASDQTLVLLHQASAWVPEGKLVASVEYSNASVYRTRVLAKLHKARMIEFDKAGARALISPKGGKYVEEQIIAPRTKTLAR